MNYFDFLRYDFPLGLVLVALGALIGVLISVAWILAPFQGPYKLRPAHAVVVVPGEGH